MFEVSFVTFRYIYVSRRLNYCGRAAVSGKCVEISILTKHCGGKPHKMYAMVKELCE